MRGEIDDPHHPLSPDRHRHRTDTCMEALDFLRVACRQALSTEGTMTIFDIGPAAAPAIIGFLAFILLVLR